MCSVGSKDIIRLTVLFPAPLPHLSSFIHTHFSLLLFACWVCRVPRPLKSLGRSWLPESPRGAAPCPQLALVCEKHENQACGAAGKSQ